MHNLTGHFKSAEGGEFELFVQDNELMLKFREKGVVVKRLNETTGLIEMQGQKQEIRFYLDPQGKPWGVGHGVRIIPRLS